MHCVVLLTKAPIPGEVKTRLTPCLTDGEAARLHEAFVRDTVSLLSQLKGVEKYIACHPGESDPFFEKLGEDLDFKFVNQGEGDLGDRLKRVLAKLSAQGFDEIVVIGSDSPTLPPDRIDAAFDQLAESKLVLGPSLDGGYYLIGFSGALPEVFDDINWGTETVFEETVRCAEKNGDSCAILPYWYDVDTMQELRFLAIHLEGLPRKLNRETREAIECLKDKIAFSPILEQSYKTTY